jgi:inhibitor of KinA sporulation pathway (predicted exonuclease)
MEGIDHFIILDFESTCEKDTKPAPQEIIEFPSVVLDAVTLESVDQIQIYVRPVRHKTLSRFCTDLTGITQETVDKADIFRYAFKEYDKWIQQYPNSVFITCGDWDLKTAFPAQCRTSNVNAPSYYRRWLNIKKEFSKFYNVKPSGMAAMLEFLGMELLGRHHSGLDDCVNTGRLWSKMIEDGYQPTWEAIRWIKY